jgi:hypothetical protein
MMMAALSGVARANSLGCIDNLSFRAARFLEGAPLQTRAMAGDRLASSIATTCPRAQQ